MTQSVPVDELIADIYPLSPLQQGMLFHLLREPGSASHLSQVTARLHGVDPDRTRAAWELLATRHPVLRTGFVWEDVDEPVQVVYQWATLPVDELDLRGLDPRRRERAVAEYLAADQVRGFRADDLPLARLGLLRLADDVVQVVWTHHTIMLDGWSSGLLFTDLERIEAALAAGETPPPVPGPPFRDYIARIAERDLDAEAAYWRTTLRGVDAATKVPFVDTEAVAGESAQLDVRLSTTDSARIRSALRELRVSFAVLARAAWALVLARCGGGDDVLFGMVASGRSAAVPGIEDVVGLLTNTVPVRVAVPSATTCGAWLRELAGEHAGTLAHEHSPLTEVRRHSGVPGGQSLFETALVVQNFPISDDEPDTGRRITDSAAYETMHLPLAVFLVPGDQVTVRVGYRRGVVSEQHAELVAGCVRAALAGLADHTRPVGAVPVLDAQPSAHATPSLGPHRDWAGAGTVAGAFAAVVAATPDAVAVVAGQDALTYDELDRCAEELAKLLVAAGAGPERRVGVVLERSVDSVTTMLAVLKAGAGYVPVDPTYPAARIRHLLADSSCDLIVTRSELGASVALPPNAAVICLDELADTDQTDAPRNGHRLAPVLPDNLAYVIYTSGSTGVPKGVVVSHRAVLNTLRWLIDEFGVRAGHVVAHKVPVGFTDAIFEVLMPLCAGATVSIMDNATARDVDRFQAALRAHRVTHTQLVPRQIEAIAAAGAESGTDPVPELEWVVNAAEPLPVSFAAAWDRVCANARITNIYGMTESAIFAVWQHLPRGRAADAGVVPIGLPMPNTTARVLSAELEPCPPGLPGELYLSGTGIARGYLGRPGLTAERFVPDPYGPPGAVLYRTGDLARWLPDASGIDYLGRVDFQLKVRGMRVEPGEVEVALRGHPAVRDAVVLGRDHRLTAYLVPAATERPPTATVRDWLAERLPAHLVPASLAWLDELPMTDHGKVDRRRLPEVAATRVAADAPVPPGTPVERTLAELWAEVLGVDVAGTQDDFFGLGGDSLLAIRLVGRVRAALAVDFTLAALFEAPTVAAAAARVSALLDAARVDLGALLTEIENS